MCIRAAAFARLIDIAGDLVDGCKWPFGGTQSDRRRGVPRFLIG
jgi:hypothetical protein